MPTANSAHTRSNKTSKSNTSTIFHLRFGTNSRIIIPARPEPKSKIPARTKSAKLHFTADENSITRSGILNMANTIIPKFLIFLLIYKLVLVLNFFDDFLFQLSVVSYGLWVISCRLNPNFQFPTSSFQLPTSIFLNQVCFFQISKLPAAFFFRTYCEWQE